MLRSADVKAKARELGFDICGIAPATPLPELRFLGEWIASGYAGSMAYLERSAGLRADVRRVMPSARVVIVTGTVYNTARPYSTECSDPGRAQIARYGWGDDYHDIIGRRLEAMVSWMRGVSAAPFEARAYVDTGPVQERVYAQHAGVGWIGKNTCVIDHALGSWLFLGEIICSLPLDVDSPALDQCGDCELCLEACPTGALVGPRVLDATRCISYWTIEHRGSFAPDAAAAIGSHVYGCDVCQEVCPWNAAAPVSSDSRWQPRPAWDAVQLVDLADRSDDELRRALRGSAMARARVAGLRRNIAAASHNSGTAELRD